MVGRNQAEKKQFKQRKDGLMKKANDLRKLCGVNVAVVIEDGDEWFMYRSKEGWPLGFDIEGAQTLLPEDFTTLREASLERPMAVGQSSLSLGSNSSTSPALTAQSADDGLIAETVPLEAQIGQVVAMYDAEEITDPKEYNDVRQRNIPAGAWPNAVENGLVWNAGVSKQSAISYDNRTGMINNSNQHIHKINSQPNVFPTMGPTNAGQEGRGWITNKGTRAGIVGNYARCLGHQQSRMYINP